VRFCITGGGFVGSDTLYLCNALGYALYNGYGMTEIGIGSVELRLRARDRLSGSVGRPFPSAAYKIENGELLVNGPTLFSAMLEDGNLIARDPEAWYATGDMARCDEDGFYYIDGRLDDRIVTSGGENLLPDMLEQRFEIDHIRQLCIVALHDAAERPVVTLVIEPEADLPSFIMERMFRQVFDINRALPLHEQAARILVADEPLPVVMDGKVQRRTVRLRLAAGSFSCHEIKPVAAGGPTAVSKEFQQALSGIMALFAEVLELDIAAVGPDTHLVHDLGSSSLQYFTLLSRIAEEYRVAFDPSEGAPCATPREFTTYILGG
jgi:acyl-CoA synthetase (AMP-forming)/AMP-acid ligase II/acyl carrier protein